MRRIASAGIFIACLLAAFVASRAQHVEPNAISGGGGGGASSTSQLTDLAATIATTTTTSDTARLTVPSGSTPIGCGVITILAPGNYDVVGGGNWTTNAANQAWEYFNCHTGQITIDTNFVPGGLGLSSPTSNVTIGSTAAGGFPSGLGYIPIASWTAGITSNQWAAHINWRAFLHDTSLSAGTNVTLTSDGNGGFLINASGGGTSCSPVGSSGNILTSTGSGCTTSGNFNWSGSTITNNSSNVNGTALELNNTSVGGHDLLFINGGSSNHAGWWFIRDSGSLQNLFAINLATGSPEVPLNIQYCFGGGPGDPTSTCDAGIARATAKIIVATDGSYDSNGQFKAAGFVSGGSAFTISTNGCSAAISSASATAGVLTSGVTGSCTFTLTWGSSTSTTHGWACNAWVNNASSSIKQVSDSSNTAGFSGSTTSGDVIKIACLGVS